MTPREEEQLIRKDDDFFIENGEWPAFCCLIQQESRLNSDLEKGKIKN